MKELEAAIREYIEIHNERPKTLHRDPHRRSDSGKHRPLRDAPLPIPPRDLCREPLGGETSSQLPSANAACLSAPEYRVAADNLHLRSLKPHSISTRNRHPKKKPFYAVREVNNIASRSCGFHLGFR